MPPEVEEVPAPRGALSGRVAVVAGGASGIGRNAARAMARQGARVVIADIDADRMERTVEEILALGSADAALALPTDVRSDASVRSMAADSIKAMGRVDILINMAGVLLEGPLDRLKASDWKWMLDTNLVGPVRTTMALLPHMKERGSGHIVNAISVVGGRMTIAYDAGGAALSAFTRSLAADLRGSGVNVTLFTTAARIGQNTRSRGMDRLLHPREDLEENSPPSHEAIDSLIEALHHPRLEVENR